MERWPEVGAWRGGARAEGSRDGEGRQRDKEGEEEGEGATTPQRELVRKPWREGEAEKAKEGGHRDGDQERVRWGHRDQDRE